MMEKLSTIQLTNENHGFYKGLMEIYDSTTFEESLYVLWPIEHNWVFILYTPHDFREYKIGI